MIEVRVYFWSGTADEQIHTIAINDDNATVLDLKQVLVSPDGSPFAGYQEWQFGIADYPNGYPNGLADDQALVDDAEYMAVME
ncbi:hypothetical protein [Actinophytocola sp.]|uniref:hypothetical protein n=1 Tax=Actinophytocola sp. TaxID=1872138 RepID=UPI003899D4C7